MTNSRLTDPEILEMRFPVELEDFHIREDSGGKGKACDQTVLDAGEAVILTTPTAGGAGKR
jgi:N-methylhydantoinase B/oxoprolinase/acetone carboxylase alpha subunit